jgi:hypothetical protein
MLNRIFSVCALGGILLSGACPAMAQLAQPEAGDQAKERLKAGSEQFLAKLDEAAHAIEHDPPLKNLSQQQRKELVGFVGGNMLFVLTHELGHAVIGEMDLYVLGREEDAADTFAVTRMLDVGTDVSAHVLVQAATGWFMSEKRNQARGIELTFYEAHGLDRQRAYQIVCMMVGSDPQKFAEAAEKAKLPKRRQRTCRDDYKHRVIILEQGAQAAFTWRRPAKAEDRCRIRARRGEARGYRPSVSHHQAARNGRQLRRRTIRLAPTDHARDDNLRSAERLLGH